MGLEKKDKDIIKEEDNIFKDMHTIGTLEHIIRSSPKVKEVSGNDNYKHLIARGYVRQEKGVLYATEEGRKRYEEHRKWKQACREMKVISYEELHRRFTI